MSVCVDGCVMSASSAAGVGVGWAMGACIVAGVGVSNWVVGEVVWGSWVGEVEMDMGVGKCVAPGMGECGGVWWVDRLVCGHGEAGWEG